MDGRAQYYYAQPAGNPPYVVQQPPVMIAAQNPIEIFVRKFKKVGVNQIVNGVLCILFSIVSLVLFPAGNSAAGIWGGVAFIAAGIMAIVSSANLHNIRIVIGGLVAAVIAGLMALTGMIIEALAAASNPFPYYSSSSLLGQLYRGTTSSIYYSYEAYAALHALVAVFSFAELIAAIYYCVLCYQTGFGRQQQGQAPAPALATVQVTQHQQTVGAPPQQYAQQNPAYANEKA